MKLTRGEAAEVAAGGLVLLTLGLITSLTLTVALGVAVVGYAALAAWISSGRRIL